MVLLERMPLIRALRTGDLAKDAPGEMRSNPNRRRFGQFFKDGEACFHGLFGVTIEDAPPLGMLNLHIIMKDVS